MKRAPRSPVALSAFLVKRDSGWFLVVPVGGISALVSRETRAAKAEGKPKARPATARRKEARHVA